MLLLNLGVQANNWDVAARVLVSWCLRWTCPMHFHQLILIGLGVHTQRAEETDSLWHFRIIIWLSL